MNIIYFIVVVMILLFQNDCIRFKCIKLLYKIELHFKYNFVIIINIILSFTLVQRFNTSYRCDQIYLKW